MPFLIMTLINNPYSAEFTNKSDYNGLATLEQKLLKVRLTLQDSNKIKQKFEQDLHPKLNDSLLQSP